MTYQYYVTAVDVHENESSQSNTAFISLGEGGTGLDIAMPINQGWNWISFNTYSSDMSLISMFSSV